MRAVDEDAPLVQRGDELAPQPRQAAVRRLEAAVAEQVADIVGLSSRLAP